MIEDAQNELKRAERAVTNGDRRLSAKNKNSKNLVLTKVKRTWLDNVDYKTGELKSELKKKQKAEAAAASKKRKAAKSEAELSGDDSYADDEDDDDDVDHNDSIDGKMYKKSAKSTFRKKLKTNRK